MFFNRLQISRDRDIGIDLGTANTLVWMSGVGEEAVLNEPSVVAVDLKRNMTIVGQAAKTMLGRTPSDVPAGLGRRPSDIIALRPLSDGVISDADATARMLNALLQQAHNGDEVIASRLVIAVPGGVTASERRELRAAVEAHARQVFLVDEAFAAALGADLPVMEPKGTMIVDIGGGTTEVAVFSYGRAVLSESLRVAGDEFTAAISMHLKKAHNLVVGEQTAEEIKIELGAIFPEESQDQLSKDVRGQHLLTGLPRTVQVRGEEIREVMAETASVIVEAVRRTLERVPPELASDIVDRGIMFAGGGALVRGLSDLVARETGMFIHVADNPSFCVVRGTRLILDDFPRYAWVLEGPDDTRPAD
ncbi:MAG: rod shape-determining protein [Cyanobacteriota bacterium]